MPYEDALAAVPLFSQLTRKDLSRLGRVVVERTFKEGETIVNEGEPALAFFMLTKGRVVEVRGDGSKPSDRLNEIGPGGFFGGMGLIDGAPRSASIKAIEETECLVLSRWDYVAELRTNPQMAVAMLDPRLRERD